MKRLLVLFTFLLLSGALIWAQEPPPEDTHPAPRPSAPSMRTDDLVNHITTIVTPEGALPAVDPFAHPPGANFRTSVYTNMFDGNGIEMVNTLPSSPTSPYNLLDGGKATSVTPIDPTSPTDDLLHSLQTILSNAQHGAVDQVNIQFALDILEGNPIPSRPTYSGIPILHYIGPLKHQQVDPVTKNVNVHQIWYDSHIESDTALLDVSTVLNEPYTITYTIDVLHRGSDDFANFIMYFDDPALTAPKPPLPHFSIDGTFFPMQEGTRVVLKMKMAPGKYLNLIYHWGWRVHPPRVQVIENLNKKWVVQVPDNQGTNCVTQNLLQWEQAAFGVNPRADRASQLAAIAKIGELAPEKRMWQNLITAQTSGPSAVVALMQDALLSFDDWTDRTHLPRGVKADPNTDATLFYVNNTIYGGSPRFTLPGFPTLTDFPKWTIRPQLYKVTLLNGDHFTRAYLQPDFGGRRGWANLFQSTLQGDLPSDPITGLPGTGCNFTFGRLHWWINAGGPGGQCAAWQGLPFGGTISIPQAGPDGTPGYWRVDMTLNFEPSLRLRLYQFDPLHHDTAIFSLH